MKEGVVASSVWDRPERGSRGPAPALAREDLGRAAGVVADAEGLDGVTMRSAAAAAGTAPASLYRYVTGRDELVELMVDEAFADLDLALDHDGVAGVLELARRVRVLLLRRPWLLGALATRVATGPRTMAYAERALAALAAVDAPGSVKLEAFAVVNTVVRALVDAEVRRGADAELTARLVAVAADGEHPSIAASLGTASTTTHQEPPDLGARFDRLVRGVLDGVLGQS
jgi:AcrR family transcriptional regulator